MNHPTQADDPYAVLGVSPGAPVAEVRRAYHRLSQKWHPDHHMQASPEGIARAEALFKSINHAYVVICQAVQAGRAPTPVQVQQRTRQEEQLATVAHACTQSRLMMVALNWSLNPYTYRRDVDLTRRILSDAVVFGARAFPRGFLADLRTILVEQSLASEEAHVRTLLDEAMQVIVDHAPLEEVAAWEAIFAPLGYERPAPRPARKAARGTVEPRGAAERARPTVTSSPAGRGRARGAARTTIAIELAVVGGLLALGGPLLAGQLLAPWIFIAGGVLAILAALALLLLP